MKTYQMFIGGQWVDAVSGATFDDLTLTPYTGEVYARVAKGDKKDADRAKVGDNTILVTQANIIFRDCFL